MAKEKMSLEKKVKLIYSGELIFFALVFIALATLEILGVIGKREIMMTILNWVTIFGGTWMIADFIWVLCSKRRQRKNSILDKALLVPAGIYLITFDIICFVGPSFVTMGFRRLMMGILFYYLGANYLFQGIYHWFRPIPGLFDSITEAEEKAAAEEPIENQVEEVKEEEKKTDE